MDVLDAIKKRRSVRRFKKEPFPEDILFKLLEAASHATSAGNIQPWKFFVVRNSEIKAELARAALNQNWMVFAPVIIVVCADLVRSASVYGKRGCELYAIQDTAAATENILLGASEAGLGACWVGAFREDVVADILGINAHKLRPVAMVAIGYPAEAVQKPAKRPLSEIVEYL